jgi:hypothetical protein
VGSTRLAPWRAVSALAAALALCSACGEQTPTAPTPPPIPQLVMQCPADVVGQAPTGSPVTIQVPPATATGGVLPISLSCSPAGAVFPVGSTRVACQASDARGTTASCTFNVTVAPPPLSRTVFLAFGDSMTAGEITVPTATGLRADGLPNFKLVVVPTRSYPSELLTLLRARYITQAAQFVMSNAGLPREWAIDGAVRFPQVMAGSGAQVVLLLEGVNDLIALGTPGVRPAVLALQSMIRAARIRGATVFVASLPPPRPGGVNSVPLALVLSLNDQIRVGAPAEGAVFVDVYAALATNVNLYIGSDGLHPTEAGYQRIAETFFAAIRAFEGL